MNAEPVQGAWPKPSREQLAAVRRFIVLAKAAISPADHDHRGPRPCPVCGGLSPEARAEAEAVADDDDPF